jgi:predicted metal-dependent HD superfamily phosphohydrolase
MINLLLKQRWVALCDTLGIPEAESKWQLLETHYEAPGRKYHSLRHISFCLSTLDQFRHQVENPLLVEYALWLHDVVYDTRRSDNELKSAELARNWIANDPAFGEQAYQMVLSTVHPSKPASADARFMADVDLSVLALPRDVYALYAKDVRHEYQWVPDAEYKVGRGKVLNGFLNLPHIFHTPGFIDLWEGDARRNLKWELKLLASA